MKRIPFGVSILLVSFALWSGTPGLVPPLAAQQVQGPTANDQLITRWVLELIQETHLLKPELSNDLASKALDEFLRDLDPNKQFFLRSDITEFNRGKPELANKLKKGDVTLAFEIYRCYQRRFNETHKIWKEALKPGAKFDFTRDEVIILNPKALDYPRDLDVRAERLRLRAKYQILLKKTDPDVKSFDQSVACNELLDAWERLARDVNRAKSDDVLQKFLYHVCQRFDAGTYYLSKSSQEKLLESVRGNFAGIGINTRDCEVLSVIPGTPAAKEGGLKPKDRIVTVGQGEDGEMVNISRLTTNEMIDLIRGPVGSIVRLGVVRPGENTPQIVSIRRAKVAILDAKIEARVFEQGKKLDGTPYKIGYINLPSFYVDKAGDDSSTKQVGVRLKEFTAQGVDAAVLDLRRCKGGVLDELMSLAGLFVGNNPIMQYKNNTGEIRKYDNADTPMVWSKGLVIVTDKDSSSGAELLAAAIQDYNRSLLVGDESTYGTGTLQSEFPIVDEFVDQGRINLGSLIATTGQLYRLNGDSVQNRGVLADIILPFIADQKSTRAGSAVGFGRVTPIPIVSQGMVSASTVEALRVKSLTRRRSSADFEKLQQRIEWEQSKRELLLATLNEATYRAQQRENAAPVLPQAKPGEPDYYLKEVITIAADYASLLGTKTATPPAPVAKISPPPPPPPPPDPEVIRRAERDAEIAVAGQAVYQGEQYLSQVNNSLVGARLALALAKAAYQKTKPGSVSELVAELAAVAAQSEVDSAMAEKSRAESNLRAARDRYNRLKSEK